MRVAACALLPLALLPTALPAQQLPPPPGPAPVFTPSFYVPSNLPTPQLTVPDPPAGEWPVPEPGTTPAPPRPTASLGARVFPPSERALREEQDLGWQASTLLAPQITGRHGDGTPVAPEQLPDGQPMAASLLRQARGMGYLSGPAAPPRHEPASEAAAERADSPASVPFFEVAAAVSAAESPRAAAPAAAVPQPTAPTAAPVAPAPMPVQVATVSGHVTRLGWLLLFAVGLAGLASLTALWRRTA